MVSSSSINIGSMFNKLYLNIGLNYSFEYIDQQQHDSLINYNDETSQLRLMPEITVGYFIKEIKDISFLLESNSYANVQVFQKPNPNGIFGNNFIINEYLLFGIEYEISKIGIGAGIGPEFSYTFIKNPNSTYKAQYLTSQFKGEIWFKYYFLKTKKS
jgi:hypothetical protein